VSTSKGRGLSDVQVALRVNGIPIDGLYISFCVADRLVLRTKSGALPNGILVSILAAIRNGRGCVSFNTEIETEPKVKTKRSRKQKENSSESGLCASPKSKIRNPKSKVEIENVNS
jgi:hypothetical protein